MIVEWRCGECSFRWYEYYDFRRWEPVGQKKKRKKKEKEVDKNGQV